MFQPLFCPYPPCPNHRAAQAGFYVRHGHYHPRCRSHPVPRFLCRLCKRSFSRQSFCADRRHKKPHLNAPFLRLMVSCVGLRQAARALQVSRRTVERRFHWLALHARHFHLNRLRSRLLLGPFQLDELESFESNRYQPLTVPVLIERHTLFILATSTAPLRRKGRLTPRQHRLRARHEAVHGRRPSQSSPAVREVLEALRDAVSAPLPVVLESDEKPLYGALGRLILGKRFVWRTHSATARRDHANPLFPVNHTNARLRHFMSRLRRRTWCVSKRRACLQRHLWIVMLWANYCRGITNRTHTTPAQALGLAERAYRPEEVLRFREDWGRMPVAA